MTKHPKDRKPPMDMLNSYKEEFDRLLEISPNIDDTVVIEFKNKFGKNLYKIINKKIPPPIYENNS